MVTRALLILLGIGGGLAAWGATSPSYAWYDAWGRWHPNRVYRPPPPPYYAARPYWGPPPSYYYRRPVPPPPYYRAPPPYYYRHHYRPY